MGSVRTLDALIRSSAAASERATNAALMADWGLWVPEAYFHAELASKQAHNAVMAFEEARQAPLDEAMAEHRAKHREIAARKESLTE